MKTPALVVLTIAAFAAGILTDRMFSSARAAPDVISAQVVHVPNLTENDMGGNPGAAVRSKNYVTLDGITINVQIGGAAKHLHPIANEIQYIVDGSGKFWLGDKEVDVKPGDMIVIPKGTAHGSSGKFKAIAIKSPVASNDSQPVK